jgi:hypothetical protein
VAPVRQDDVADGSTIAVPAPDPHHNRLPECEARRELLGSLAEGLPLLRGVDPMQTQGLVPADAQDRDRVPIGDADHQRTEVFGVRGEDETEREDQGHT